METLKRKIEQLNGRNNDINEEVNYAEQRSRKKRRVEVKLWQEDVRRITDDVQTLERQEPEVQGLKNAFKRAKLGKRVVETIKEVEKLYENGGFCYGLLIDDPTCGHTIPTAESLAETTSVRNKEKIWNFLMDDAVRKISVQGRGGVGKTTIMKHINNQLLVETCTFNNVIWVTVSKAFKIKNLQWQIAKKLNLGLSDYKDKLRTASEIHNMLSQKKRYVLILDDLWKAFPLEEVGTPEPTRDNGCKLVLTTRSLEVSRQMECVNVEVECLTEAETLNLFMRNVKEHQTVLDPQVNETAKRVAKKCARLSLVIVTVARSMKGVNEIHEWRNAKQIMDKEKGLFKRLKFKDCSIGREELIEYWISEGLIREMGNRESMNSKGHTILNKFINTYLLEESEWKESVKMHDLIRDMALKITSTSPRFMVGAGEGLKRVPQKDWSDNLERVSLMRNDIEELPFEPPICPHLTTFLFQGNWSKVLQIPGSFFMRMPRLKVLDLSDTAIESLPNSISMLENLHQLLLRHCYELKYVLSLEKLKALEHFKLTHSQIEEVPQDIEELVNLKRLELSENDILGMSPYRKLCRLMQLLYLRIQGTKAKLSVEELLCLKQLKDLKVLFHNVQELTKYVKSVQCKSLEMNSLEVGIVEEEVSCNYISIYFSSTGVDVVVLPSDIEDLRIRRWDNHISLTDIQSLRDARGLRKFSIEECDGLESVFSSSSCFSEDHISLTRVEELEFWNLPNFRVLFDRVVPPHNISFNLKILKLWECPKMESIFPALLLQNFPNLEELRVYECENVEEIIVEVETSDRGGHREDDGNTITLPNLEIISTKPTKTEEHIQGHTGL
ncbi:Disease resistance protein SUMM2 [Camellia lanceoleosa]|uniref:Disease resistance protein SUMM2 n=1 Tax=Camellia lanceoleosa TaxID=1840588 RepID=A0ACC0INU5_9ERIC|nr:Disease resistance protein SUMM2 [Camellia lanceoleosa]